MFGEEHDNSGLPPELLRMLAEVFGQGSYRPDGRYVTEDEEGRVLVHGRTKHEFNHAMDVFLCRYIDGLDAGAQGMPDEELAEMAEALTDDLLAFFSDDVREAEFALKILRQNASQVLETRQRFTSGGHDDSNRMDV